MRNAFNALVIASAFALLVPDNRAQALSAADFTRTTASVSAPVVITTPAISERTSQDSPQQSTEFTWLLALGFLGVVVSRRLRAD